MRRLYLDLSFLLLSLYAKERAQTRRLEQHV